MYIFVFSASGPSNVDFVIHHVPSDQLSIELPAVQFAADVGCSRSSTGAAGLRALCLFQMKQKFLKTEMKQAQEAIYILKLMHVPAKALMKFQWAVKGLLEFDRP